MKKILVLLLILSLTTLCACRGSVDFEVEDTPDDAQQNGSSVTDPIENVTVDWETPIDIDDSFQEEIDQNIDAADGETTNPADENEPTSGETSGAQNNPTEPTVTEPDSTKPSPTDPVETSRPSGSGPIELPMIPG